MIAKGRKKKSHNSLTAEKRIYVNDTRPLDFIYTDEHGSKCSSFGRVLRIHTRLAWRLLTSVTTFLSRRETFHLPSLHFTERSLFITRACIVVQ